MSSSQDSAEENNTENGSTERRQPSMPSAMLMLGTTTSHNESSYEASDRAVGLHDGNHRNTPNASNRPIIMTQLHCQDAHTYAITNLQTGITKYHPFIGQPYHRDPLCDLPHLINRQDLPSQRLLYLFLLIAGPGHWGSTVQIYNHLFHRTSDVMTPGGSVLIPAPPLPTLATEADLRRIFVEQDLFPTDRENGGDYLQQLRELNAPFIGQGRQRGMRYELEEVLEMLRGWIEEAGIQLVRNRESENDGTG